MAAVLKFPLVPVAIAGSSKDVSAYTVRDTRIKGIKPGYVLVCRPYKLADVTPETIVIVRTSDRLMARRVRDVDGHGDIEAVVFAVQKPL